MIVYRICKRIYAKDLSGKGAELQGGRWNTKGIAAIYVSPGVALCTTEVAVHTPLGILPDDFVLVTLDVPENSIKQIAQSELPKDWKQFPHSNSTQILGSKFLTEGKFLLLKVPSAVIQGDFNYMINPNHPDAVLISLLEIEPYQFDKRFFER